MGILALIGITCIIYKAWEEKRWDSGIAHDVDWNEMLNDSVKVNMGEMSKRQLRENYRNGKYNK